MVRKSVLSNSISTNKVIKALDDSLSYTLSESTPGSKCQSNTTAESNTKGESIQELKETFTPKSFSALDQLANHSKDNVT